MMKKVKLRFWYSAFCIGVFLSDLGDAIFHKSMDRMEILVCNDQKLHEFAEKLGMVRKA